MHVIKDRDLLGHSMALTVSCLAFTAEFRIQTQPSPFETCGEQRGIGNLMFIGPCIFVITEE